MSTLVCASCGDPVDEILVKSLSPEVQKQYLEVGVKKDDLIVMMFNSRPRCLDCYRELTTGRIPPASRITSTHHDGVTTAGRGTKEDDAGPWNENARRHLEGD